MVKKRDFFEWTLNPSGSGYPNDFKLKTMQGDNVIVDLLTGLTWQQSGSPEPIIYEEARDYIRDLNDRNFAGYSDWRLPTLEEAMSLMEAKESEDSLFINSIFDKAQTGIWTADWEPASRAYYVNFSYGSCYNVGFGSYNFSYYVRAVR